MLLDVKWAVKHEDIKRSACITYVMTMVFKNQPFLDFIAVKKKKADKSFASRSIQGEQNWLACTLQIICKIHLHKHSLFFQITVAGQDVNGSPTQLIFRTFPDVCFR